MKLSTLGAKLTRKSGILELMDDLGKALSGGEHKYMLGGGNPAHIPEINALWRERMGQLLNDGDRYERMLANYDTPQGHERFLQALAALLRREFGWPLTERNIAVTNGINIVAGLSPGAQVNAGVKMPRAIFTKRRGHYPAGVGWP